MPRSHGKFGERRSCDYPKHSPYIPKRLAGRQKAFDDQKDTSGDHRPGSQNPRKR